MPDNIVTDPSTGGTQPTQPVSTTPVVPVAPVLKPTPPSVKQMTAAEYVQHLASEADNKPAAAPVTPTTTPTTNAVPLNQQQIDSKYANNPYLVGGRDKWAADLNRNFNVSGTNVKQSFYKAANSTNVDPSLLYASVHEEGLPLVFPDKNGNLPKPTGFTPTPASKGFPTDSLSFGLDSIGEQVPDLIRRGLLPADFKNHINPVDSQDNGQTVTSYNMKNEDDGVLASAAILKKNRDILDAYTKSNNINLTPRQEDFFNLAAFNSGDVGAQKMLQSYKAKGYLKDDSFLDDPNFKPASYGDVYTNVQRRLVPRQYMNDHGVFSDYKPATSNQQPAINNQNRTDYNAFVDSKNPSLEDYIKQNPKTSLTPQMAGALQQDLNAHKDHLKNLVNTGQAVYDNGVDHDNVGQDNHKFSTAYMAANK